MWPLKHKEGRRKEAQRAPLAGSVLSLSVLALDQDLQKKLPRYQESILCTPRSGVSRPTGTEQGGQCMDNLQLVVAQHDQMIVLLQQQLDQIQGQLSSAETDWARAGKVLATLAEHMDGDASAGAEVADHMIKLAADQDYEKVQATAEAGQCDLGLAAASREDSGQPQTLRKALNQLAKQLTANDASMNRDDCGSMRSYCTSISMGSTQASAPVILDDMPLAGKGTAEATAAATAAAASAMRPWDGSGVDVGAGVPQWQVPLGMDAGMMGWGQMQEEISEEEVQQLLEDLMVPGGDEATVAQRQNAICCLALHAERDEDVRAVICEDTAALNQLLRMLQDTHQLPSCQAASHLAWYISRSEDLRPALGQPPLIAALLGLLRGQDPACARAAAFCINNLAHEAECRQQVASQGAVPALIDMMSCSDAVGQEASAAALMMLCSEEPNICAAVVAHNGVKALAAVLQYGGPAAQEAAACALENLSLDAACEAALGHDGALEGLVSLLQDGSIGAQAAAASTLRNLAVNVDLQMQMFTAGALHHLLQTVSKCEEAGTKLAIVEAIRNLATGGSESRAVLVAEGALPVLVGVARSMSGAARAAALGALLAVSTEEAHKKALINAGAVGVLVHAALSGAPLAREYAARCITNLATCDSNRMELLKEGAATVLVALTKSYCSSRGRGGAGGATGSCCYVAVRALQNLAKSRAARRQLQDAGAIQALIPLLLLSNSASTASAISTLAALCNTPRAVAEFQRSDGVRHLAGLISSAAGKEQLSRRSQHQARKLLKRTGGAGTAHRPE